MKIIILAILVVASNLISSGSLAQTTPTKKPKIIVGLMVDQMRWDYLYKYQDRYGGADLSGSLIKDLVARIL